MKTITADDFSLFRKEQIFMSTLESMDELNWDEASNYAMNYTDEEDFDSLGQRIALIDSMFEYVFNHPDKSVFECWEYFRNSCQERSLSKDVPDNLRKMYMEYCGILEYIWDMYEENVEAVVDYANDIISNRREEEVTDIGEREKERLLSDFFK